jgi:hypothetical protein
MQALEKIQIQDNAQTRHNLATICDKILIPRFPIAQEGCTPPFFTHTFM